MTKKNKKTSLPIEQLIKAVDVEDPFACPFKTHKERLMYMKKNYGGMSIPEQFAVFYGETVSDDLKKNKHINNPIIIEVGGTYTGSVHEITKRGVVLDVPGVKEEIISKENFTTCIDNIQNYLVTHNNELMFKVLEKKNGKYYVSILEAYYESWKKQIDKAIEQHMAINVHIDSLIKGGYMCHTNIWPISELTGKTYTSAVFIPGSNIVLNIETDFARWLDKDVEVIPQNFTKFKAFGRPIENSLTASRKMVLKIYGMKNMYDIYYKAKLAEHPDVKYTPEVFTGKVTGIINSNKKTGVFIEIEDKYITGLMPVSADNLLNYKPGDNIQVYIKEFECMEGKEPFVIDKKNVIRACNIRPVFDVA